MSIYDNETSKIYPDRNLAALEEPQAYRLKKLTQNKDICLTNLKFVTGWQKR